MPLGHQMKSSEHFDERCQRAANMNFMWGIVYSMSVILEERMSHHQLQEFGRNASEAVNNGCSSDTEEGKGQVLVSREG